MRIIAGKLKGRKIIFPDNKNTRPLRDFVKESIFNIIENSNKFKFKIKDSIILDLFSGSGSFGLECVSRGSKEVIFFENYPETLKILQKNIDQLKLSKKCEIFNYNSFDFSDQKKISEKKFDLVFIDPPYEEQNINLLIEDILKKKILRRNGVIIIHRHKKDDVEITHKFKILDIRFYGISKILIGH
tara:strand:- start:344 stop:904 length:561 start_codon:yes stop_codon:yes gene_type:complete